MGHDCTTNSDAEFNPISRCCGIEAGDNSPLTICPRCGQLTIWECADCGATGVVPIINGSGPDNNRVEGKAGREGGMKRYPVPTACGRNDRPVWFIRGRTAYHYNCAACEIKLLR